jgi:molybdopterin-guanine dinucleotide biosynthesis protein A
MGRDKALLPYGSSTLAETVCEACQPGNRQVLLAPGRPDRVLPESLGAYPKIYDRRPGRGPLAAIEVLLESCLSPWLVVVPCDMVGLERADLELLLAEALRGEAALACFDGSPWPQTFPLALRVETLRGRCGPLFSEGRGKVLDLAQLGPFLKVPTSLLGSAGEAARKLANLNDQDDYRGAREGASGCQDEGA